MEQPYTHIGVVGAGAMGRGIVQLFAQAGVPVRVVPGVSSAMASAAAAVESFTLPEVTQYQSGAKLIAKARRGGPNTAGSASDQHPCAC